MIVLGLDCESTGLDVSNDRITELACVIWDTERKVYLSIWNSFFYDETYPQIPDVVIGLNGITTDFLMRYGERTFVNLLSLDTFCRKWKPEYIIAHGSGRFDEPLLKSEIARCKKNVDGMAPLYFADLRWLDTRTDVDYPNHFDPSRKLKHIATEHEFCNPFPHRATSDVLTMLRILRSYDINQIIDNSKIPLITIKAEVGYADRELAKTAKFHWDGSTKSWTKEIRENTLDSERQKWQFPISII